jgi:hypothetical protein
MAWAGKKSRLSRKPITGGLRRLGGDDLDRLAVLQLIVERHHAAIDFGAARAMPKIGVDLVRKVERRAAHRHIDYFALGGDYINAVLKQIDAHAIEEIPAALVALAWRGQ